MNEAVVMLQASFLGQFDVRLDGQPADLSSQPAQTLLAYLLLNAGVAQRREQLAGLLWPDSLESSARKNLRNAIWLVRKAIGDQYLLADKTTIAFDASAPYELDVAILQKQPPDTDLAALIRAVSVYRGDLLPGYYEDWVQLERERLRGVFERRMQVLLDRLTDAGQWSEVQRWAEHWIALGHVPEPAYRALMISYAARGDLSHMASAYRRCVKSLQDELDVSPSTETQTLYQRLSQGEVPVQRQPDHPPIRPPTPVTATDPRQRFVIQEILAVGGHGEVFLGQDQLTEKAVVIKRLKPELMTKNPDFVTRFVREGEILRQLNHPNVVQMLAAYEEGGEYYIVMEYVPGGTLRDLLDKTPQLPLDQVLDIGLELADALGRAHHLNVIHRDIKPDNVLLADDGTPRLTDFGMARLVQENTNLTRPGAILGSPAYMSPEALRSETLDARSDIWAFGVLLFEMLAGFHPYDEPRVTAVLLKILNEPTPNLQAFCPDAPPALISLVQRMLVKERKARIASMRQVAASLEAIRDGLTTGRDDDYRSSQEKTPVWQPDTALPAAHLVGRDEELQGLLTWLDKAAAGTRQILFVTGETGLGKTALVERFLAEAAHSLAPWIGQGQCMEYRGAGEAYMPVLEALGRLCRAPGREMLVALLDQLAPTWLVQMPWLVGDIKSGYGPGHGHDSQLHQAEVEILQQRTVGVTRERMLREMAEFIEAVTAERPLILLLEDLHWADPSTLDLITWLARRQEPARLLLIGTYRPADVKLHNHPLQDVVQELHIHRQCVELNLSFLTETAVAAYLAGRFPELSLPDGLATLLHQRTAGNPLFMHNVVDAWLAQKALAEANSELRLQVPLEKLAVDVPDNLRALIEQQFRQLKQEECDILHAASVVGVEFSAAVVAAIVEQSEEKVEAICDTLAQRSYFLRSRGISEWPDGTVTAAFSFTHHLYQAVLYDRVTAGQQVRLHRQIGKRLEVAYGEQAGEQAAELADHFVRGRDARRAIKYLQLAAEQALQRSAHQEAIGHLTLALELLATLPDTPEQMECELTLQAALAPALLATKGWVAAEVEQAYLRARDLSRQLGATRQLSSILYGLAVLYEFRGEYQKSQLLMEQRLELPHLPEDTGPPLQSYTLLACSRFHQGSFAQAAEHAQQGLTLYNPEQHVSLDAYYGEEPGIFCHYWAAHALWFLGYPDQAVAKVQNALTLAEELGYKFGLVHAQEQAVYAYQFRREVAAVQKWAAATVALAAEQGFPYRQATATILGGWALAMTGELDEGLTRLQTGLAAYQATGAKIDTPYYLALLAEIYGRREQFDRGLETLNEALALVRNSQAFFYEAEIHRLRGELLWQANGRAAPAEVEASFEQALHLAREQQAKSLELRATMSLARLWQAEGKTAEARQVLATIYDWFSEGFATPDLQEARDLLTALGHTAQESLPATEVTPGTIQTPLFVARQQEMDRLQGLLKETLAGENRVALIVGEAGQGKTSLLQAFVRQAQKIVPNLIAAGGYGNAYTGSGDPYLPFREILELLTGDVEASAAAGTLSPTHAARLQQLLPVTIPALIETGPDLLDTFIATRRLLDRATAYVPQDAAWLIPLHKLVSSRTDAPDGVHMHQSNLFEQYARVLQVLANQAPLLLFLDDLQWADLGSANLLLYLGKRLQGYPILILGAYRPAEVAVGRDGQSHPLARVVQEFQRDFGDVILDLSQAESRAFVDALLDAEPNRLGDTFRDTLYRQTGGHPLFTIELLRGMQERGDLAQDENGRWQAQPGLDWKTLPARVEGAIGARIGRLSPSLRELLQVASIEGEEFTVEVVAQVLNADPREIARLCSRELDKAHHLVRALGVKREGSLRLSRYRFQHILIQRFLYNNLDPVERAYLHESIANALETLLGAGTAEIAVQLARHLEEAEMPERAAAYLEQAGDKARQAIALEETRRYYQAALQQWPMADRAGHARVLRKLGECQWVIGRVDDALASFETCFALAEADNNVELAGAVQRMMGRLYWEKGDREKSLHHYHGALAVLEEGPEDIELARTISSISQMYMLASEYDQAISWGERALAQAKRIGAEAVIVHALNNIGNSYSNTGQFEQGRSMLQESARRALELGLPHDACRALLCLGEGLAAQGYYEEARRKYEELLAYATRTHIPLFAGSAAVERAKLDWLTGNWQAALAQRPLIKEWIEKGQSLAYVELIAGNLFGRIYNDLGQVKVAHQILAEMLPEVQRMEDLQVMAPHLGEYARSLAVSGLTTPANEQFSQLLQVVNQHAHTHRNCTMPILHACYWFVAGTQPDSLSAAQASLRGLAVANTQIGSPETAAALSEGEAVVALRQKKVPEAIRQFQEAASAWQALGRPLDEARAQTSLGRALVQARRTAEAQTAFDRALSLVELLANQLEDEDSKSSFLNSALVQNMRDAGTTVGAAPHNLPAQPTAFVGRERELADIRQMLEDDPACRLLTLIGPGGSGKTRLSIQAAAIIAEQGGATFTDGVYFVPLAPLSDVDAMVATLASTLDLVLYDGQEPPYRQLLDALSARRLLLLLDNFEHLLDADSVALVTDILTAAPHVKLLTTSRVRLNVSGEQPYTVSGLEIPAQTSELTATEATAYSAIQLFQQHAHRARPDFELMAENVTAVVHICRLAQGMPLAIELAAAWLKVLSTTEIATEIEQSLDILETEWHNVPERQRSLRAVFNSSWQLLDEAERAALQGLAIFQGGFTRQAAQAVTGISLKGILALADKSWLQRSEDGRYQIHELLRQYAAEKLHADPDAWQRIKEKHSAYYVTFLREQGSMMWGPHQREAFDAVAGEFENVRFAWDWLVEQGQLATVVDQMLPALFRYCELMVRSGEILTLLAVARQELEAHRRLDEDGRLLTIILITQAAFSRYGYPIRFESFGMLLPAKEDILTQAWVMATALPAFDALGYWGTLLAYLYGRIINREEGMERLRHVVERQRQENARWEVAFALELLAHLRLRVYKKPAERAETEAYLSEALDIFEALGDEREGGYTMRQLGQLRRFQRAYADAIQHWQAAQARLQAVGDWPIAAEINWQIGDAYLQMGNFEAAFSHYRQMSDIYLARGYRREVSHILSKESYEALRYGEPAYARQTRQRCLNLARETGDSFAEAWSTWEMGEIYRVTEEYDTARRWYEDAKLLFDKVNEPAGYIFYHRGLGDLACALGNYAESELQFQKSVAYARAANHTWGICYARAGLARAAALLGEFDRARAHLTEALQVAAPLDEQGILLLVTAAAAQLYAALGKHEYAAELSALVANHYASWRETKVETAALLETVAAQLPSDVLTAAQAKGWQRDLWQTADELIADLPTLATPSLSIPHNLPAQMPPLIGREKELAEIRAALISANGRLLTLTGPGGIGKTRLALAIGTAVMSYFPHGVYFIPLAPFHSAEHIVTAVAESVGFHFHDVDDPRQQLLNYLRSRQMLFIMDNFEHLLVCADLVAEILQQAPQVKILATSREHLNLSGERTYLVGGLDFPDWATPIKTPADVDVAAYSGVQLLLQRARQMRPDFELRPEELHDAGRICRLVQGMPLGILLAASWLELLSLREIGDEIAQSLDFLESEMQDLPARQRSMRAVFDASWKRLTVADQQAFMKLSTFRGGFTRQAAKAVANASLKTMRTLANNSFIAVSRENRYEIHELLRQYGQEHLETAGQVAQVQAAHTDYYLKMLTRLEADIRGKNQPAALNDIEADFENIRLAWEQAVRQRMYSEINSAMETLHLFMDMRGRQHEGANLFRAAYSQLLSAGNVDAGAEPVRSRLLLRCRFMQAMSKPQLGDDIAVDLKNCLAVAQQHEDEAEVALCLSALGAYELLVNGDANTALAYLTQAHEQFVALQDGRFTTLAVQWLSLCHQRLGNRDQFHAYTQQSLELARLHGDKVAEAYALSNLAEIMLMQGEFKTAENYWQNTISIADPMRLHVLLAHSKLFLALLHFLKGDMTTADLVLTEAIDLANRLSFSITIAFAYGVRALLDSVAGNYASAHRFGVDSVAISVNHGLGLMVANWALATAYVGQQQHAPAWQHARSVMAQVQQEGFVASHTWLLPVTAVLLAHSGAKEQAVEMLALAHTHPLSPTGWLAHWSLVAELRDGLEQELGTERYQAAWARGQRLDLDTVVTGLLALESLPETAVAPPTIAVEQEIRFCISADNVRLAYATAGKGPPLVKAANWLSHLEFDLSSSIWQHWIKGFSQRHILLRYDERGCGLSSWEVSDFSVDAWVQDLEAVVTAAGLERFPLFGISQGAAVAIAYAARYPQKVTHLVLCGGFARGFRKQSLPTEQLELTEAMLSLVKSGWGRSNPAFRQLFTSLFIPGATAEQMRWFNDLQRASTSPENAFRFLNAFYDLDVTHLAAQVRAPTLVLHARRDGVIPFKEGQEMAARIANARFVSLESQNHILLEDEPAWQQFLTEFHRFVDEPVTIPALETGPASAITVASTPTHPADTTDDRLKSAAEQEIRFCSSADEVRLAYATVGQGPPLVKAANWLSHLEYDWESPVWRHWLQGLSQHHRLIRYDERGCGLSDWDAADMSFEAWLSDLEAVVDAAGVDRFPLLGISQGGAIAIAYAVRHSERVSHLILYGSYARGKLHRNLSESQLLEAKTLIDLIKIGWGRENPAFRQVFSALFMPDGTPDLFRAFNELQRVSSSPENAARIVSGFNEINVTELARQVTAPTLVLHARDDGRIPFEEGRLLAGLIPNARFVPLESKNHILLEYEPAWQKFLTEFHRFVGTEVSEKI
jgi:predicted ATPase/pimeloyl-ACP methyl ester carboxylesterase/DNA-binding SARP family transcriptional activator/tRNA A-37 threonylcarbamoyl transferase component Bud32